MTRRNCARLATSADGDDKVGRGVLSAPNQIATRAEYYRIVERPVALVISAAR
jgi:hypothetical protein